MSKFRYRAISVPLGRREAGDVERRADEARLLRAPPGEADLVGRLHLLHGLGHLEDGRAARAVVVDAGPVEDGVEVTAHHDHVVGVAGLGLGQHVEGGLDLAQRVGEHPHLQPWRVRQRHAQRIGGAEHRDAAGVVGRERDRRDALAVGCRGVALVEDHDAGYTGGGGVLGLQLEGAGAALEQGDVPRREAGEVRASQPLVEVLPRPSCRSTAVTAAVTLPGSDWSITSKSTPWT